MFGCAEKYTEQSTHCALQITFQYLRTKGTGRHFLTLAQMVWRTYLEKYCPSSNGHTLILGGSKRLPECFGALIYCHNGDFTNFLKLVPECLARSGPRVPGRVRGGEVWGPIAIWAMLKRRVHEPIWAFSNKTFFVFLFDCFP